jgi:hypothetical protein
VPHPVLHGPLIDARRGGQAFDLARITNTGGAPFFAFWRRPVPRTHTQRVCAGRTKVASAASLSTLPDQGDSSIGNQQLIAQLSVFFSLLATLPVCIGIYGPVSYAVARSTKEIGVRMALGAARSRIQ